MMITLAEYAAVHGKAPVSVRQMIARGSLRTAEKVAGNWMIDADEPYPDNRRKGDGFEMRHGMYVVDEIAYPKGAIIPVYVRIGADWYRKEKSLLGISPTNPAPTWTPNPFRNGTRKEPLAWLFAIDVYGCVPRDTDHVRKHTGRSVTTAELDRIREKTGMKPLGERESVRGAHYGPEYAFTIREAFYELEDDETAQRLADGLRRLGIEADHCMPRTIGIRID
ncbi:putative modification methylase HaeIII [Bifidobacterium saguini DSM 23967]|uniref:Putative modification methylase HaeIII n=1 Tax=Bifidobacterium saguini DSM 23967 TaxID=1437607 RepID=A0A087DCG3_9BIFI|nr:hypothetical protein [Bifidobacterium saguini]KFI93213.1 putative modification methylase HaeIII [Bifidobacterium saguini DSM 23967]